MRFFKKPTLPFILVLIAVAACAFLFYGAIRWRRFEEARPSKQLLARLGPSMKGFRDFDPENATYQEQAIVNAAGEALMQSGVVIEGFLPQSQKLLRSIPGQKGWEVGFWSESRFEGDHHINFLIVDVDKDGKATFTGRLVEM